MSENNKEFTAEINKVILIPHIILIFIIIGLLTIWKPLITILTTKLKHNGKVLSGKTGWIHTISIDTPLSKITSIKCEQGLMGKIFNYGTIIINTSGDKADYIFPYIKNPYDFKDTITSHIE